MKKYGVLIAVCAVNILLASFMASCSEETSEQRIGSALLQPSANVDVSVATVNGVSNTVVENVPEALEMGFRLSAADGKYSKTWDCIANYPLQEPLRPGTYLAEVFYGSEYQEGFDTPYFYGAERVSLSSGEKLNLNVTARLANTVMSVKYAQSVRDYFRSVSAVLHASGGAYISYPQDETRCLYLRSGMVDLNFDVTTEDGRSAYFEAVSIPEALAGRLYEASVEVVGTETETPELVVSFDDKSVTDDVRIALSQSFFASAAPELSAVGFSADVPLQVVEGTVQENKVAVQVTGNGIKELTLTVRSATLASEGVPVEVNLLALEPEVSALFESLGLKLGRNDIGAVTEVDFTDLLGRLRYSAGDVTDVFTLEAKSVNGRLSSPISLEVRVLPVEMTVIGVSDVIIGINQAHLSLLVSEGNPEENIRIEALAADGRWVETEILDISERDGHEYSVYFKVPDDAAATVDVRVLYCGEEKARMTLKKVSPRFTIDVDAFAYRAVVKIVPEDSDMLELITSLADVYVNGDKKLSVARDDANGFIEVLELSAGKSYDFAATMFSAPTASDFTPTVTVSTERASVIPNGGFEDVKDAVHYKNLRSGGRYSQNIVDIFNQQNYASYDQSAPKSWANTNAKTFCMKANNHNTWYMQPSVYSVYDCVEGSFAVKIQGTAWDTDGETIPDYRQESTPYVNYSRNIPSIAHKAAGKLFLGSYGFDASTGEETYDEGISFRSRPAALNGYYKYVPPVNGQNERGLASVEVLGEVNGAEIVIARAKAELSAAMTYTAFSVPLVYNDFGVKATRIKVMLASSTAVGSIAEETARVITYTDAPTATSLGGALWVDGLIFSY